MVRIAFLGDVGFVGRYEIRSGDVKARLSALKQELEKYDYVVCNLETPLTSKTTTRKCKAWHLRADTDNVQTLKWLGVNAVNLANNHTFDYGKTAVKETIRILEHNGIEWFGVFGKTLDVCSEDNKLCFSGYNCLSTHGHGYSKRNRGISILTYDMLKRQRKKDAERGFFSVMFCHWGVEFTHFPEKYHILIAHGVMNHGNCALIGSHPHYIQGMETSGKKNSFCAYSLGNGIYDEVESNSGIQNVPFMEENKKMLLLSLSFQCNHIVESEIFGWYHGSEYLHKTEIKNEIMKYSKALHGIVDWDAYQSVREMERSEYFNGQRIVRDFNWLKSRMNYNMIGGKIREMIIDRKLKKERLKLFKCAE